MRKHFSWAVLAVLAVVTGLVTSCGSETSSAVTISGSLAVSSSRDAVNRADTYKVRCVTLSGTPTAGEGTVDTTSGAFSLEIASATNVPIGCFVLNATTSAIVGVVSFESTSTGIDGSPTREGSYIAEEGTSGLSFGTVTLNLTTGTAKVEKTKVVATGGNGAGIAGTWTDPTGTWKISAIAGEPPTGYAKVCPVGQNEGCNGPHEGETVYMKQYSATEMPGSKAHKGFALWKDAASFTACNGEGVTLPAGWTADAGSTAMTSAMSITTAIPDPATIDNKGGVCDGSTSAKCDAITGTNWGMSQNQCRFYCAISGMRDIGGCTGDVNIDWAGGTFHTALGLAAPTWSGSAWTGAGTGSATAGDLVTYLNGSVKINKKRARNRHMMNEIIITGAVGSVQDNSYEQRTACASYGAGGCTGPQTCNMQRTMRLTMTQTSATTAVAELVMRGAVAPSDAAICTTDQYLSKDLQEMKVLFNLTKQP